VHSKSYAGNNVWCPVCSRSFKSWLNNQRHGSCPYCRSETRHRITCLYLQDQHSDAQLPIRLLYFAPHWGLERWFRKQAHTFSCTTTDLSAPNVDVHADITNLPFKSQSFDLVVCCHVLEHIPNDEKAISELFRVLHNDGTALIQVPCNYSAEYTDEDLSITDPHEREKRFGQFDHVRLYGQDIVKRLKLPGFKVEIFRPTRNYTEPENKRLGLWDDAIFVCRKGQNDD